MEALFNPQTMLTVVFAIAAFGSVIAIALPYLQTDDRAARLKSVAKRREELSEAQKQRYQQQSTRMMRATQVSFMKRVIEGLRLQNLMDSKVVRDRLLQAGKRGQLPIVVFTFAHVVLPIGLMILAAFFVFGPFSSNMSIATKIIVTVGAGGLGFALPTIMVGNLIAKRQQSIMKAYPDALDLLVICVESGSSMEAAFNRVAEELSDLSIELAEEFGMTTAELAYLTDRREALDRLAIRTGLPAIKSLTTALIQSEKYGTPLGTSLRVLAQENRDYRMSVAEKKAASLPAKLTVPMIGFFLPVLFIVILGPAIITTMARFS